MLNRILSSLVLCFMLTTVACNCWQPEHRNDRGCAVLREIVDCTVWALESIGPALVVMVEGFLDGGQWEWSKVGQLAASMGFKDAGCFLSKIQSDYQQKDALKRAGKLGLHEGVAVLPNVEYSAHLTAAVSTFTEWKMKNNAEHIQFSFAKK